MNRVDLDAIKPDGWATPNTVLAMVAELRAAREVIQAASLFWDVFGGEGDGKHHQRLAHALNAYDEAVTS